ncbi:MAG: hypothetical protein M1133_05960 [Armatimonadetes bacterium]|nr:hypothetical protein [Armatimonadota bacterium]
MFLLRRASVVLTAAVLLLTMLSGTALAAKSGPRRSKVYVPAKIIKGSLLTSGRSFFKSGVPEDTLAGIRLGREAREILARWGNPSRITVGTSQQEGAATEQSGPAYMPSGGSPYASVMPGLNQAASMAGLQGPMPMPMMPPMPGFPAPGGAAPVPGPTGGGAATTLTQEEVTWTYDLPGGITLEFIITDGLITQITVGGTGPYGGSRTRTGLQLGDTYKLVLWVCGYPESQKYVGRFLRVSYVNKNRALFTFLNRKLVGVTIAMVPQEITL